jgi:hypothetical protein
MHGTYRRSEEKRAKKEQKTYNSRYSLVVTHPTTNLPISSLCMAERTGCPVLLNLWSYMICHSVIPQYICMALMKGRGVKSKKYTAVGIRWRLPTQLLIYRFQVITWKIVGLVPSVLVHEGCRLYNCEGHHNMAVWVILGPHLREFFLIACKSLGTSTKCGFNTLPGSENVTYLIV